MEHSIIAMLDRTADGAMLADEQGTVALWNKAAERLLGFRADDVLDRPCYEVMRDPFRSPALFPLVRRRAPARLRKWSPQLRYPDAHTKGGKVIWLNVSSLPVPSRKKDRFLFVHLFRDIGKQAKVRLLVNELYSVLSAHAERPAPGAKPPSSQTPPSDTVPDIPATLPLSRREREVLQHLALGERTTRIADILCISPATVRNHLQHIFEKLGAHSRIEVLAVAFHHNTPSV